MASLLDLILAKVRGGPLDYLPAEPEPRTTADGGLDLRALLTGAQVQPEAKSQYEPTLAAGEQRSVPELQDMLWNVVNSAGMESLPGIGPHKIEQRAPGRVRPGAEAEFAKWFGGSKIVKGNRDIEGVSFPHANTGTARDRESTEGYIPPTPVTDGNGNVVGYAKGNYLRRPIDEAGDPLTVYHGTSGEFTKFEAGKTTPSGRGNSSGLGFFFAKHPVEAGFYAEGKKGEPAGGSVLPVHLRMEEPYFLTRDDPLFDKAIGSRAGASEVQAILRAKGHDGAIMPNGELVVFDPKQIKSATGNRGTYSRQSADIRE